MLLPFVGSYLIVELISLPPMIHTYYIIKNYPPGWTVGRSVGWMDGVSVAVLGCCCRCWLAGWSVGCILFLPISYTRLLPSWFLLFFPQKCILPATFFVFPSTTIIYFSVSLFSLSSFFLLNSPLPAFSSLVSLNILH